MTVTLTSPVLGKQVDDTHTGPEEDWLLAQGYAKRTGYTGPGVAETGPADVVPAKDLTLAVNREPAPDAIDKDHVGGGLPDPGPLDPALTFTTADDDPNDTLSPDFDFDPAGVNNEAPTVTSITPATGGVAGGTAVTLKGQNFDDSTSAAVGGVNLTSFVVVDDETITGVTGAHAAGAVTVSVTNPVGTGSKPTAFTYA